MSWKERPDDEELAVLSSSTWMSLDEAPNHPRHP